MKRKNKPFAILEVGGFVVEVQAPDIEYRERAQKILPLDIYPLNTSVDFENYPAREITPESRVMVQLPPDLDPEGFLKQLTPRVADAAPERGFDNVAAVQQAIVQASEAITKKTPQVTTGEERGTSSGKSR